MNPSRMKEIDIILPVYNEEAGIAMFDESLRRVLAALRDRYQFHMIYVVDRSKDRSFGILKDIAKESGDTTVIHLSRRFGHQMSLVAGMDRARGDAAIMMDSDLQHPPALIPVLLEKFEEGFDIVHTVREYDHGTPFLKRLTSNLFYRIQNALSPVEIPPGVADFRLVARKALDTFQQGIREHNQFLRGLFQWVGLNSAYVPFRCEPRVAGTTKYSVGRLLAFFSDGILSFSRVPLRAAILTGLIMSGFSLIYGCYLLFKFVTEGGFPRGYTSLILTVLFVGGLQITLMGVIAEYIGHVFDEVKNRPLYIVEEVTGRDCDGKP
jgi:glycosyltransferase involved in cell wall biosynthesis